MVVELALAAGSALVGAMATDAWKSARAAVVGLFTRRAPAQREAMEAQLDSNAALVAQADDPEQVRQALRPVWELHWDALLRQVPDAEDELRALVAEIRAALPPAQQTWVQTNIARPHATQYNVQHGNLHVQRGSAAPGDPGTGTERR